MQDFRKVCKGLVLFRDGMSIDTFFERFACGEAFDISMQVGRVYDEDEGEMVPAFSDRVLCVKILSIVAGTKTNTLVVTIKTVRTVPFGFKSGTFDLNFDQEGMCSVINPDMFISDDSEVRISTKELTPISIDDL